MENIKIVESFIENSREQFQIDDDVYGNILVAVTESVNNAIQHGNKLDKNKNVTLQLLPNENAVTFVIADEGPGFDHTNLPDPTAPENVAKPNGRGIFLMKHLVDKLDIENNGATVKLTFYLN